MAAQCHAALAPVGAKLNDVVLPTGRADPEAEPRQFGVPVESLPTVALEAFDESHCELDSCPHLVLPVGLKVAGLYEAGKKLGSFLGSNSG